MVSDRCLSVLSVHLSVTLVHCGQTVGRIKMKLGMQVGLGLAKPSRAPPQFSAHVYCGQAAGWINVALSMEVGLDPGDIVLWGPSSSPKNGQSPQFSAHFYCGQTAGWMKTPLGPEVDLSPGHFVLDGCPGIRERGTAAPLFSAHVCCGHGRPSQLLLSSCVNGYSCVLATAARRRCTLTVYLSSDCSMFSGRLLGDRM